MYRLTQLSVTALLLVLLLPAAGPIIDHHFAERQPWHSHVGAHVSHTHDLGVQHAHPSDGVGDTPIAVYNYEGGGTSVTAGGYFDIAVSSRFLFEPSSILRLPAPVFSGAHQSYGSPPDRPPPSPA